MQHFTVEDVLSESDEWWKLWCSIYKKKLLRYKVYNPKIDKIIIEFEYEEDINNIKFTREFNIVNNDELIKKICNGESININCCYVKNFSYEYKYKKFIVKFISDYAFYDGDISFDYSTFSGMVSFDGSTFTNQASFNSTTFSYKVSFEKVTFSGKALFCNAKFNSYTSFDKTKFYDQSLFESAIFSDSAIFSSATFSETASFSSAIFNSYTSFDSVNFNAITSFYFSKFILETSFDFVNLNGKTDFSKTKFLNGVHFHNCTANSIIIEKCTFQNDESFEFRTINKLVIDDCIIKSTFNLKNFSFYPDDYLDKIIEKPCEINILSFKNTQNLGRINIDWDKNKVEDAIKNNGDTPQEQKEQFAMLKENYHNIGDYESEDKAFVAYMRSRRETLSNWFAKSIDKVICLIGRYGTKPSRIAITMAVVWFVFSVLFSLSALISGIVSNGKSVNLFEGFYFSAITFFTIGYGDVVPAFWLTKILAPIEGALGLFLMSYFTVAVVRKTLR